MERAEMDDLWAAREIRLERFLNETINEQTSINETITKIIEKISLFNIGMFKEWWIKYCQLNTTRKQQVEN